jgi:hypothetical protein
MTHRLLQFSLFVNVVVAGICSILLFIDYTPFTKSFGIDNTARQILSCIYLAIALVSLYPLIRSSAMEWIVWGLLPMQIIYKLLTVVIVKDKKVPIIWFNLGIALLHLTTLYFEVKS